MSSHKVKKTAVGGKTSITEMRKGVNVPNKTPFVESVSKHYPKHLNAADEIFKKYAWLKDAKKLNTLVTVSGRIAREVKFSTDLRGLYSVRFAPDGERYVSSFGTGAIEVGNIESNESQVIRKAPNHGFSVMCVRFVPKRLDEVFASSACGTIFSANLEDNSCVQFTKENGNEVNSIDIDYSGSSLLSGGKDAILKMYDINTGKIKLKLSRMEDLSRSTRLRNYHETRVFAVKYHPDSSDIFLSGGWDNVVKMWDARSRDTCIREFKGPHICGDAIDIQGDFILTGSWTSRDSLQLWDINSSEAISTINPVNRPCTTDGEFLYCAQFFKGDSTGNTVIVGGSGLGVVEVIQVFEMKVVASFPVHKSIQAIDSTQKYIIFGGMESKIRIAII